MSSRKYDNVFFGFGLTRPEARAAARARERNAASRNRFGRMQTALEEIYAQSETVICVMKSPHFLRKIQKRDYFDAELAPNQLAIKPITQP